MKNSYEKPCMDIIRLRIFADVICASSVTDGGIYENGTGKDNPFKPMPNGWIE